MAWHPTPLSAMDTTSHTHSHFDPTADLPAVVAGNISCPMHKYDEYKVSRTSWGIGVLGSIFVKLTASDGTVGYATGFGGPPACWLIEEHYRRFIVGKDPRDTNMIWDQMFRASMFYGRKGEYESQPEPSRQARRGFITSLDPLSPSR